MTRKLSTFSLRTFFTQEERDNYLKNLFGDMNPRSMAVYSRNHPEDPLLHEYITRFTSKEFNRELFRIIPHVE